MTEAAMEIPLGIGIPVKEHTVPKQITLYHITPKENAKSIEQTGLKPLETTVRKGIYRRADFMIDVYCKIFGLPVTRSGSVYAFEHDPRFYDADNLPYDPNKHMVLQLHVDPHSAFVADSERYAETLMYLSHFKLVRAHIAAIKYARSVQPFSDYIKNGPNLEKDYLLYKPEVLLSEPVRPTSIAVIAK